MCKVQQMTEMLTSLAGLQGEAHEASVESVVECVVDAGRCAGHRGANIDRNRVQSMVLMDVEKVKRGACVDELPTVSLYKFLNGSS